MQRRSFLTLLGLSPVAPAVASDVMTAPAPVPMGGIAQSLSAAGGALAEKSLDSRLRYLVSAGLATREDIVKMIYARTENYPSLDPDIAALKSFSPSAKMRLQRMRDAEQQADSFLIDGYYNQLGQLASKFLGDD